MATPKDRHSTVPFHCIPWRSIHSDASRPSLACGTKPCPSKPIRPKLADPHLAPPALLHRTRTNLAIPVQRKSRRTFLSLPCLTCRAERIHVQPSHSVPNVACQTEPFPTIRNRPYCPELATPAIPFRALPGLPKQTDLAIPAVIHRARTNPTLRVRSTLDAPFLPCHCTPPKQCLNTPDRSCDANPMQTTPNLTSPAFP